MKFGKHLQAQRAQFAPELAAGCLDYKALKQLLKPLTKTRGGQAFFPPGFRATHEDAERILVPNFAELVDEKLTQLKGIVTEFLLVLDAQVLRTNECYVGEAARLTTRGNAYHAAGGLQTEADKATALALLDDIVRLEAFASVNATGINKILKKAEKVTGLDLREPYLYRISLLPVSKGLAVAELRARLVSDVVRATDGGATARVEGAIAAVPTPKRARTDALDVQEQASVMNAITAATQPTALPTAPSPTPSALSNGLPRPGTPGPPTSAGGAAAATPATPAAGGSAASGTSGTGVVKALFRTAAGPLSRSPSASSGLHAEAAHAARKQIIVTMSGPHGAGLLDGLLGVLAEHQCRVHDVSLVRVHQTLTVGALIDVGPDDQALFPSLLAHGEKNEATVNFEVQPDRRPLPFMLSHAPYDRRTSYVVTLVGDSRSGISPNVMAAVADALSQAKTPVYRMKRLSQPDLTAVDFKITVAPGFDLPMLRKDLAALAQVHGVDLHLQHEALTRRMKRLVVFDMDSTLIRQECIDELARMAGKFEQVQAITHRAMEGKCDFKESLRQRVACLAGLPVSAMAAVKAELELNEGALELCQCLRGLGCKLAVVSGGFMPLISHVQERLGIDHAFGNELEVSADGTTLTGAVLGEIVDAQGKAEALTRLAAQYRISRDQVVAVGDGSNDLLMMAAAGAGIAYRAKPIVQEKADFRVNNSSLLTIMYLLGYTDRDIKDLLQRNAAAAAASTL